MVNFFSSINMNCSIINGELIVSILYNAFDIDLEFVSLLGEKYKDVLNEIVKHCLAKQETVVTISDLDTEDLNDESMSLINDFLSSII